MAQQSRLRRLVTVDTRIDLASAAAVAAGQADISIADAAWQRCRAAEARLHSCVSLRRHVYGVTTGFGPLANRLVSTADGAVLQQNLVHHLASGVGPPLSWKMARALVLARLMSILQGVSGASEQAIRSLLALLRSPLAPCIPSKGTVGASGDLTPLSHLVLCLQGRGDFCLEDGGRVEAKHALDLLGIAPLTLQRRDGLALVNGTSAMTGAAVVNSASARRSIDWSIALSALFAEGLRGRAEAWHPAFSLVRPHRGQADVASRLIRYLDGSTLVDRSLTASRRLDADASGTVEAEAGQDAYTLRCVPQVVGAAADTLDWHDRVVEIELNAATDNPIFPDIEDVPALHGGNFMGTHVALVSDALATSCLVLAGLAERQIARITDERLNRGLPAFLHRGPSGLNSGFMGAQVTATALLAEMRALHGAASAQSLSTNGANQDIVSMGTIAARLVADRLHDLRMIQAILALCVAQAAEMRIDRGEGALSAHGRVMVRHIRRASPRLDVDRPLGAEIEAVSRMISASSPPRLAPPA